MTSTKPKVLINIVSILVSWINDAAEKKNRKEMLRSLSSCQKEVNQATLILKENFKRQFINTRKELDKVSNFIEGLSSGIADETLNRRESKKYLESLNGLVQNLDLIVTQDLGYGNEEISVSSLPSKESEVINEWKSLADAINTKLLHRQQKIDAIQDDKVKTLIDSFKKYRAALPIRQKQVFEIINMPIIPIFDKKVNDAEFKNLGIQVVSVDSMFCILLNQKLLLVSKKYADKHNQEVLQVAENSLETLNETGEQFSLVSHNFVTNPRNSDQKMYWIMPTNKLNALMKVYGRRIKVTWGLPFDIESVD